MRKHFLVLSVFVSLAIALFARAVLADCSTSEDYKLTVDAGTVVICPMNLDGEGGTPRQCPQGGAMLRQAADGGGVVTVASYCSDAGCYVDECVNPGAYRYGYAKPYACCSSCCETAYFDPVIVGPTLGPCTLSTGDPGPIDGGTVPWGEDGSVCSHSGEGGAGEGGPGEAGAEVDEDSGVHTVPADASIRTPDGGSPDAGVHETPGSGSSGCGCSVVGLVGGAMADFGALALAASLLVRRRARARRRG